MTYGAQGQFHIKADLSGGRTLEEFGRTLQKRVKYLNETAFQAIHAMAIDTLKSIRGVTKVAKPAAIKVDILERGDLVVSYFSEGHLIGGERTRAWARRNNVDTKTLAHETHRKMCIRNRAGFRFENNTIGKFVFSNKCRGVKASLLKVYQFTDRYAAGATDDKKTYLIASPSRSDAAKEAKMIVFRRVARFAGLAKRALSALMIKTNNRGPADNVGAHVYAKANEVTEKRDVFMKSQNGDGKYALLLEDNLRYARRAVRGESAAIDLALKKAANKSIGLIQHRCKDLLGPGELKTPFPEITKRKAA